MRLVVARDHLAIGIDREDRVVGGLVGALRRVLVIPVFARRAGQEDHVVGQHAADLRQRRRIVGEEERKDRFRPDEMGDADEPGIVRRGLGLRELDESLDDRRRIGGGPVDMLEDRGLDEPHADVVALDDRGAGQPVVAVADLGRDHDDRGKERHQPPGQAALVGRPDQRGGRREQRRDEGEAVDADRPMRAAPSRRWR